MMAVKLLHTLKERRSEFLLKFSPEELDGLQDRIQHGQQTQDNDHKILCQILNVGLEVWSYSSYVREVVVPPPGDQTLRVRFMLKSDGAGVSQGHFDLLWLSEVHGPSVPKSVENNPGSVSQGISVRGVEVAEAILSGHRTQGHRE